MKLAAIKFSVFLLLASIAFWAAGCTDGGSDKNKNSITDDDDSAPDPSLLIMDEVSAENIRNDLVLIAGARPRGSEHWEEVRDLCAERFNELGLEVELHDYGTGVNVIGTKPGSDPERGAVIISAHYDSIPNCDGADDNGSGVAGVLEAARVLSGAEALGTLVFACWAEEENGAVGSLAYADRSRARDDKIEASYVFEMIGYRSTESNSQTLPTGFNLFFPEQQDWISEHDYVGDFIAVVADEFARSAAAVFADYAESVELFSVTMELPDSQKTNPLFADFQRSDHASFWANDYPAMMLTDTAEFRNANYHCFGGEDALATVDENFAADVIRATAAAALHLVLQ